MILALLGGVLLLGFTGWLQTAERTFGDGWLEALHETLAYGVLAAVGESVHYGENLIGAMTHGRKRALGQDAAARDKAPPLAPSQVGDPVVRQE